MFQKAAKLKLIRSKLLFFSFIVFSVGCSTTQKLLDNDEGHGEEVDLLILTTPLINPDRLDRPSPIRLDFIQLREKLEFVHTDYLELIKEGTDLNGDLVDRTQYMLHPDDVKSFNLKVNEDTKYLGVIAGYQNINESNWKLVLLKQPIYWTGSRDYLNLKIDENSIFQLSKRDMKKELREYAAIHPNSKKVTKRGKFKKAKLDYSKGVFIAQ